MPTADRTTPSIFISYSHKDKERIDPIISYLVRAGWNVWQDERRLLPGDQIMPQLSRAISEVDFYLVFLSKNSVNSPYVLFVGKDHIQKFT